jgi:hypothetical protein
MLLGGSKMFFSFGHRLRSLSGMRVGFRVSGTNGCFYAGLFMCMNALIYLLWYCLLATFWLMYGVCYLFFYLPIKAIVKLCKKNNLENKMSDAALKYTAPSQPQNETQNDEE